MISLTQPTPGFGRSYARGAAAFGECIIFEFNTSGSLITPGAYPILEILVSGATGIANGTIIKIDGIEFIADDTIADNTATLINLQGTSLQNAQRLQSILISNPHFADYYITVSTQGAGHKVTLTGKIQKDAFITGSNIIPAPLSDAGQAGAAPTFIEGYALVYQVFTRRSNQDVQIYPQLGEWEVIEPTISQSQVTLPIKIEVQNIVSCLLSTVIPFGCFFPQVQSASQNRAQFWIRYGYRETINCASVIRGIKESAKEWLYLAALSPKDYSGLTPYGRGATPNRYFLTRRCSPCVCRNACDWLYVLIDDYAAGYVGTITVRTFSSIDGDIYTQFGTSQSITSDNVYAIPAGANTIGVPANHRYYRIELSDSTGRLIRQDFTITDCDCDMLVYFLNDLGGYDYLQFKKQYSRSIEVDKNVACLHTDCKVQELKGADYLDYTRKQAKVVTNVKGMESMNLITDWGKDSDCNERLIQSFLMSPQYYLVHPTAIANTFLAAMIESVKVDKKSNEGKTRLEIDIYVQREIAGII
jgi:hypothetical protein